MLLHDERNFQKRIALARSVLHDSDAERRIDTEYGWQGRVWRICLEADFSEAERKAIQDRWREAVQAGMPAGPRPVSATDPGASPHQDRPRLTAPFLDDQPGFSSWAFAWLCDAWLGSGRDRTDLVDWLRERVIHRDWPMHGSEGEVDTAEDRRVSVEDKDMRHGRKSKSKRFNGYKGHIACDLDTNLTRCGLLAAFVMLGFVASGCKGVASSTASTPDGAPTLPPVQFVGRCVNETAGTPWQSIYFFPKKSEMFFYLGSAGAQRVPMTVTEETPRKVSFSFRWSEENEAPSTHTGNVTAVGDKWSFDFDTLKDSVCKPVPAPDFYKLLPDLGVSAGKWEDKRQHVSIVVAADDQAWIFPQGSSSMTAHYRVIDHVGNSTTIATYGKTPSDADDEGWPVSRLTVNGGTLVQELGDLKVNYKLIAAAPTLK